MDETDSAVGFIVPAITRRILLRLTREEAFRRFTHGIGQWWPLLTHSVSRRADSTCRIEGREGGAVVERDLEGNEYCWGRVERWAPPAGLALVWHPGREPAEAQRLEVAFEDMGGDRTRVTLVHSGWEALGPAAAHARASYDEGWETVFVRRFAGEFLVEEAAGCSNPG